MQSLFYKEMVVKRDVVEDASSLDSEECVKDFWCSSDTESGETSKEAEIVENQANLSDILAKWCFCLLSTIIVVLINMITLELFN